MERVGYLTAIEDFRRARRKAALEQILTRLTGRPDELMSYDEVRRQLRAQGRFERGLHDIPVDAIVGSVGRYADFTRKFLPRSDTMQERWARVKTVATDMGGWEPIEVYKLGDTYFVIDGNHRVSVAREMGMATIPAYVIEVKSNVPITPDLDPDELLIQASHAAFLENTGLSSSRPEADLTVTETGAYHTLEEHIRVHRHFMGLERERAIPYEEAAAHWYDEVYAPVVTIIRERGLLQDFPERTETDMYLWLADHRAELEEALGWDVAPEKAAEDLVSQRSPAPQRVLARVGEKILDALKPDDLEPGPAPGEWRVRDVSKRRDKRLFSEVLVAIDGLEAGWRALEQAIIVARHEGSLLRGLHIVRDDGAYPGREAPIRELHERFQWRMGEVGIEGRLVVEAGQVPQVVCDRARWNDLVVMPLSYAPGETVVDRLSSGFRSIVQRCPRPILAVPGEPAPLQRALLAYDGSAKAEEALFVTAYLGCRWQSDVVVLTVDENGNDVERVINGARTYLESHGIDAAYELRSGEVPSTILEVARSRNCDFIIMGGYGRRPVMEIVLGSDLNRVLRESTVPVLICR